jgi:hypothetical protein
MRKSVLFSSLLLGSFLLTTLAQSQSDRFAYAITDVQQDGANWSFLRKLNLQNGQFSDILLNGTDAKQVVFDAATKKQVTSFATEANRGFNFQPAFSGGVAAMAYDRKNNRLWYTPMFIDQLRYIDLKSMKIYYVTDQALTGMSQKSADQGNIVTRMAIGEDGYGYAMTNDGAHLVRFTTGKKISITDLGMLADDPANKGVSIHASCTSFGGDMIADNDGNLFVFSARNHVFKVNIESKTATYAGTISGLPANFTTNGAAVTEDNQVIISSAVDANSLYTVDAKSWAATAYAISSHWRSSDLANSNILTTKKTQTSATTDIAKRVIPNTATTANKVQLYPNPVTNNQFAIQFSKLQAGDYNIQVTDVTGRKVVDRTVTVISEDQTETIRLSTTAAKGFYLVNIINKESKSVFNSKLLVE